jgi:hypothetical protein
LQVRLFEETRTHEGQRPRTGTIVVIVAPFQLPFKF